MIQFFKTFKEIDHHFIFVRTPLSRYDLSVHQVLCTCLTSLFQLAPALPELEVGLWAVPPIQEQFVSYDPKAWCCYSLWSLEVFCVTLLQLECHTHLFQCFQKHLLWPFNNLNFPIGQLCLCIFLQLGVRNHGPKSEDLKIKTWVSATPCKGEFGPRYPSFAKIIVSLMLACTSP